MPGAVHPDSHVPGAGHAAVGLGHEAVCGGEHVAGAHQGAGAGKHLVSKYAIHVGNVGEGDQVRVCLAVDDAGLQVVPGVAGQAGRAPHLCPVADTWRVEERGGLLQVGCGQEVACRGGGRAQEGVG